ncbi:MAG TPA: hypothetical protein VLE95_02160, partial [Chlamydiales bacterium]|nr:hypothetical protein [Chlamydiales bacterium]
MTRLAAILLSTSIFTSCATNAGTGIFAGGALGAGIGGLAGGGSGSLIGSAAGILAGGLVGTILDAQDRKVMEQISPRTVDRMDRGEPLTINDIIKLSQGGVCDDSIIHYLSNTKSIYSLSHTQIRRMQDAGVSQRVINSMAAMME